VSLGLALVSVIGFMGLPWALRLRQVLRGCAGDGPATADAILVLGRQLEGDRLTEVFIERLAHAEDLWRKGCSPRIIVAGGTTGTSSRSEAEAGRDWLRDRGVPARAILLEDRSQHTLENLFNVRAEMRAAGWSTLLMISDPLHLARARATAGGLGLAVRCSPAVAAPPMRGTAGWWRRATAEAFLLHWYHTGMLYSRLIRSERQLERVT